MTVQTFEDIMANEKKKKERKALFTSRNWGEKTGAKTIC
jgi:hypothetical protein